MTYPPRTLRIRGEGTWEDLSERQRAAIWSQARRGHKVSIKIGSAWPTDPKGTIYLASTWRTGRFWGGTNKWHVWPNGRVRFRRDRTEEEVAALKARDLT